MFKKLGIGLVLTLLLAGAVVGMVAAQSREPTTTGRWGMRGGPRGAFSPHFDAVATALGMTREALEDAMFNGQSIADIAAGQNLSVDDVIAEVMGHCEKFDREVDTEELGQYYRDGFGTSLGRMRGGGLQRMMRTHRTG